MFLGIDLGTSSVKVLLLDEGHAVVGIVESPLEISRPHPHWSEQQPEQWWQALDAAMLRLKAAHPQALSVVRGIGLSGQMHGAVVLDGRHLVLRPAILWNDTRASVECADFEAREPQARALSGNLAMPGFTAPKLLWLATHEADLFAQVRLVLLPKDWLRLKLTGEAASDMSDASGTLWLDVSARRWSEVLLAACGLSVAHMPRLIEGSEPSGSLLAEVARRWGMASGVVVAGGAGDNAASAIGVGAMQSGQGFVSLGTSGVIFLVTDSYRPNAASAVHAFAHAVPGRWHQMSVMLSAASAFGWVTRLTGRSSEAELMSQAGELSSAERAQAPIFLPYLSGERTPHNDADASGTFAGLRTGHDARHLAYSVMEGVTFGLMDGLQAMQGNAEDGKALPDNRPPLALVGGGARSDGWAQMIASGLGRTLVRDEAAQAAAAVGAARLGWLATGGSEAEICRGLQAARRFEPDEREAARLHDRHRQFRLLYPALKPWFAAQTKLAASAS